MMALPKLFDELIDDAAMFPPGNADPADAVAAHLEYRRSWFAPLLGPLVVSDSRLVEVGRALRQAQGAATAPGAESTRGAQLLRISVVNSSGAGGLISLAGRSVPGLQVVAVESALRDLDDLAGNAARVISAAAELEDSVSVFVEIPYAPGWERAVAEVEGAGLFGKIRTGGPDAVDVPAADQLARQLSAFIEADLPFKATAGLHHAWSIDAGSAPFRQHGFLNLMLAVDALVDGASVSEATGLLAATDQDHLLAVLAGWDDAQTARVRRRLRSFGCCGVLDPIHDLVSLGLVSK
jgi:hypothetical protein